MYLHCEHIVKCSIDQGVKSDRNFLAMLINFA